MHNHFDQYLNLKKWILERRPSVIVECGAGSGELTSKIASLMDVYPFEFHVISDKKVKGTDPRIIWHEGISYKILPTFNDDSIGLCIIDTDHNFWTLIMELKEVFLKIKEGGLIALHDVYTFYHNTGMAMSYSNGEPYPKKEIEELSKYGGLTDALIEFLHQKKMDYRLLAFTHDSHGAALIERKTEPIFSICVPGEKPVYADIVNA